MVTYVHDIVYYLISGRNAANNFGVGAESFLSPSLCPSSGQESLYMGAIMLKQVRAPGDVYALCNR